MVPNRNTEQKRFCRFPVDALVEKPALAGHGHGHAVFVGGGNHLVVAQGAARLQEKLDAAPCRAIDIVAEGKKCVGAEGYAFETVDPLAPFRRRERNGRFEKLRVEGGDFGFGQLVPQKILVDNIHFFRPFEFGPEF